MNKDILKDEMYWLLEAINEQFEAIKKYEEKIPQIEFDIIMENVRKLYENLHLLNRLNDSYVFFEQRARELAEQQQAKAVIKEPPSPVGEKDEAIPLKDQEPVLQPGESQFQEQQVKEVSGPTVKIQFGEPVKTHERKEPVRKTGHSSDVNLFSDEGSGFTQKLKEARDKSLGPKTKFHQPGDLKSAISINEKFLLINELFDGNLRDYNESIEKLNGFSDKKDALVFLDQMFRENFWNSESGAFKKLRELVEKKFEQGSRLIPG